MCFPFPHCCSDAPCLHPWSLHPSPLYLALSRFFASPPDQLSASLSGSGVGWPASVSHLSVGCCPSVCLLLCVLCTHSVCLCAQIHVQGIVAYWDCFPYPESGQVAGAEGRLAWWFTACRGCGCTLAFSGIASPTGSFGSCS